METKINIEKQIENEGCIKLMENINIGSVRLTSYRWM